MKSCTLKLFLLLCISILFACDTKPLIHEQAVDDETQPVTEKQLTLVEEAEKLIELAENSDQYTRQLDYRVKAARLLLAADDVESTTAQLAILRDDASTRSTTDKTEADMLQTAISLITADLDIYNRDLPSASHIISAINPLTQQQEISLHLLDSRLSEQTGNYLQAVEQRVQLESYAIDDNERNRNYQKIWSILSNLPDSQLLTPYPDNMIMQGWLELARVMRSGQSNISQLENALLDWGTRYPQHPVSNRFLIDLINDYQIDASASRQIAVLLPMQGKLAQVSTTIRNGLLSAYYSAGYSDAVSPTKPSILFYDSSNTETDIMQLYRQALNDGATNIIGPLDKTHINRLNTEEWLEIPVLTLNYAENTPNYTENLFQFGLSPNDEAEQVAELAIRQNKRYAAVFYPDSDWGKRLYKAFADHFQELGGKILSTADYATTTNDYKRSIRTLLNLDQSTIRRTRVENTIGTHTQSEPYRRQDIDMIFLVATHRSARGIMPAFKFHRAGDLPVYSTSHVYSGKTDRELDRDLNGIIFCDLPWLLQNNSPLIQTFAKNWPEQENFTRLFALGVDAYQLIYNLDYLQHKDYAFYAGQTGNIQLDMYNRVRRKLLWAQFRNGEPVYFEPEFHSGMEYTTLNQ